MTHHMYPGTSYGSVPDFYKSLSLLLGGAEMLWGGQVKSSRGATHSRSEHPDPNFFLPPPLRGLWRGLDGVGR